MRRRIFASCGAALAIGVAVVALTPPASATPTSTLQGAATTAQIVSPDSLSDCPGHSLCLWNYRNFDNSGGWWHYTLNNPYRYNTWYYVGSSANDKATSLYNHRGYCTVVSKDYPPGLASVLLGPGVAYNYLADYRWPDGTSMNNSISAFLLRDNCPP